MAAEFCQPHRLHRSNAKASLGFGCMRLPLSEQLSIHGEKALKAGALPDQSLIDLEQLSVMVDEFLAAGLYYFDTARSYHQGCCEGALKRTLVDRYPRESFVVASKLPAYLASSARQAQRFFFISLEDLGVDYLDTYLLHNLGGNRTSFYERYGIWDFIVDQHKRGLIDKLGISFHGTPEELEQLLSERPFLDLVQLQINYLDWDDALVQARHCYDCARSYNKEIVVMEPLKGGLLVDLPQQLSTQLGTQGGFSLTSDDALALAFGFVASLTGVTTVLSGMSNLKQLQHNITIMQGLRPLSQKDEHKRARIVQGLRTPKSVSCTACGYCRELCPQQVAIPEALAAFNTFILFEDAERAQQQYLWASEGRASLCAQCGACEAVCPQGIPLVELLSQIAQKLEGEVFIQSQR